MSSIKYIGTDDDNLDLFEGQYPVPNGVSYNSYLIYDTHTAIIDSVDVRRCSDWLSNIRRATAHGGCNPEYIIIQHVEPDHSGSLEALIQAYPSIKVVCTAKAGKMLTDMFANAGITSHLVTVADGDTLSLGRNTLRFITAPMVHWPEVMMTLHTNEGVLFSADAFGTFAMWNSTDKWDDEARRYYANIVGRFGTSVQTVMKKLAGLSFNAIAPLHGPMLTENLSHYWKLYDKWSRYEPETDGVLVAYASVYGGTAEAARKLCSMLRNRGIKEVIPFDLCRHDVSYAVSLAFKMSRIVLASVTYDAALFPAMDTFLHHLAAKRLGGRTVGLIENGSWAPVAGKLMQQQLSQMRDMNVVEPVVTLCNRLKPSETVNLEALANSLVSTGV